MKKQFLIYYLLIASLPILALVNPQPGENIWHLTAAIGTELDELSVNQSSCCVGTFTALASISQEELTIESKIDQCCSTIISKLNSLTQTVIADFAGTFTAIAAINCSGNSSCQPTQLTTSNLAISSSGNFCMSSNLTGNIIISAPASEVTINMNGFALNGTITISGGSNIVIHNGVIAPSSASGSYAITNSDSYVALENLNVLPTSANTGGISNSGSNVIIQNCFIVPTTGTTNTTGILNSGSNVIIKNNTISGGNASGTGDGGDAINLSGSSNVLVVENIIPTTGNGGSAGHGGAGINNVGSNSQILKCGIGTTGSGGTKGGNGILTSLGATNILIKNCKIVTGIGTGTPSEGGTGIFDQGILTFINECEIVAGNGVTIGGRGIIEANASKIEIVNCQIQQTGNATNVIPGVGGDGILVSLSDAIQVSLCTISNLGINTSTISGKAINDITMSPNNVYFTNFTYNIANASPYNITSSQAVDGGNMPPGSPFAAGTDRLSNVYK